MHIKACIWLCLLFSSSLFAQSLPVSHITSRIYLNQPDIKNIEDIQAIKQLLKNEIPALQVPETDLKTYSNIKSPVGVHIQFQQTFRGLPLFRTWVKLNLTHNGKILSAYSHVLNLHHEGTASPIPVNANIWYKHAGLLKPCSLAYETGGWEVIYDLDGTLLMRQETGLGISTKDSTAKAKVFLPDPVTTANTTYGKNGTFRDFNDSSYSLLENQTKQVQITTDFSNDSFYLRNKYVTLIEDYNPVLPISVSNNPDFLFKRNQPGFEQVMVLYHIEQTQQLLQTLGFNTLVNYPIKIDAHGFAEDESKFTFQPDTSIRLGTGGIDDAEDADVIVHEYTHAISHSITPFRIIWLTESHAIEEANCDIMASAYSRIHSEYDWRSVFNWDGHNEFWNGRSANSNKKYSNYIPSASLSDVYYNSEIWSSAVCDIIEETGIQTALQLLLTSMYSYPPDITMKEAAVLFMEADSILNNKANWWKMGKHFVNRELGDFPTSVEDEDRSSEYARIRNSIGFAEGTSPLLIEPLSSNEWKVRLYDLNGTLLFETLSRNAVTLNPDHFKAGIYIAEIRSNGYLQRLKLIRY